MVLGRVLGGCWGKFCRDLCVFGNRQSAKMTIFPRENDHFVKYSRVGNIWWLFCLLTRSKKAYGTCGGVVWGALGALLGILGWFLGGSWGVLGRFLGGSWQVLGGFLESLAGS